MIFTHLAASGSLCPELRSLWDRRSEKAEEASGEDVLRLIQIRLKGSKFRKNLVTLASSFLNWEKGEASIIVCLLQTKTTLVMVLGSTMLSVPMVSPKLRRDAGVITRD